MTEPRNHRESGQILILFVLMMGVLAGFVALAIDVGFLQAEKVVRDRR